MKDKETQNNEKTKEDNKDKNNKNHAIRKGGFYANLSGDTKGVTIFIFMILILLAVMLIYIVIKAG